MIRTLLTDAAAQLRAAGVDSARTDAELLLAHTLGVPRSRLITIDDVTASQAVEFHRLVARRADREPVQYLLGHAPFRHLELAVGPGVFIPRPETELLVDAVLPILKSISEPVVIDLCAGSGALAAAIAQEVPSATVYAVERSPDALPWLRRNTAEHDVQVVEADIAAPNLLHELTGRVDVVVSNPPYVPTTTEVGQEVHHDPADAVFSGAAGLDLIPSVIAAAERLLTDGGTFVMEHDATHGESVPALFDRTVWDDVCDHRDLADRPRYVTARRRRGMQG